MTALPTVPQPLLESLFMVLDIFIKFENSTVVLQFNKTVLLWRDNPSLSCWANILTELPNLPDLGDPLFLSSILDAMLENREHRDRELNPGLGVENHECLLCAMPTHNLPGDLPGLLQRPSYRALEGDWTRGLRVDVRTPFDLDGRNWKEMKIGKFNF